MKCVVVLQARTSSSRLPAKVMLPVAGLPLVVLAAKRAANKGRTVLVVTSDQLDDDGLVTTLEEYDLPFFRGSLNDTLQRFVQALASYENDCIVVRLTADNVLPDGSFVDELVEDFQLRALDYLCASGPPTGLPYGMSAEVTRLGHLRDGHSSTSDLHDREHVTPFVVKRFGTTYFDKYKHLGMSGFRCTVDNYDDYINILELFSNVDDPVNAPAFELATRLQSGRYQPVATGNISQMVFGAAQLGMDYGIANRHGQPAPSDAEDLIKTAIGSGVEYIDTARMYGNSESVIGDVLEQGWSSRVTVITKLATLAKCPDDAHDSEVLALVDASIYKSCAELGRRSLDVLMLHGASHAVAWRGIIWEHLVELQASGIIGALGVSVQKPEEIGPILRLPQISYLQMPFNLLDWRWNDTIEVIRRAKASGRTVVHVRSAILQGLLVSDDSDHFARAYVSQPSELISWLHQQARRHQRAGIIDLCLAYVRSKPWVDGVVVGMETKRQLLDNISHFASGLLSSSQVDEIETTRPRLEDATLNPSNWLRS